MNFGLISLNEIQQQQLALVVSFLYQIFSPIHVDATFVHQLLLPLSAGYFNIVQSRTP